MSNKNFGETWEGKIERIRENLREGRYGLQDGILPIVKELVQNAEDAGAPRLLVAWHGGLKEASHPLLHGPGLLAINNGGFDVANGRAIREMGLSSKAADASSIGKFGLGMKSVFHLGEMFFFVALDADGRRIDADIRSPWSADEGGLHPDWDDFSDGDKDEIVKCVRSLFGEGRWFCLWVPLRTHEQCGNVDPIEPFWAGEMEPKGLFGSSLLERIPTVLPLLTRTTAVEIAIAGVGDSFRFRTEVGPSSSRRADLTRFESVATGTRAAFGGHVTIREMGSTNVLKYAGSECRPSDSQLEELQRDETRKWPRRFATDHITGKSKQKPEKALQHAAACISAVHCGRAVGTLRIQWAVFLPFGVAEEAGLPGVPWNVDLMLHGWFFPNAGRTAVEGLADEPPSLEAVHDSGTVRRAWNHRLAACGTLPLVPSALAGIASRCDWDDSTIHGVTDCFQKTDLFKRFRSAICSERAWLRRFSADGLWHWQAVPSNSPFFALPITADEQLVGKCFPTLPAVADRMVVVSDGEPRLALSEPLAWPSDTIEELLHGIDAATLFSAPENLDYLIRFLDLSAAPPAWDTHASQLVALLRDALVSMGGVVPDEVIKQVREFVQGIPSENRIVLRTEISRDSITAELFTGLCARTTSVVWIPEALEPSVPGSSMGQLEASESLAILKQLAARAEQDLTPAQADRLGEIAGQVIRGTFDSKTLLADVGDLKLFTGTNCRDRKDVRRSWNSIVDHHRRRILFAKPSPMAYQLQEAILDDSILLVSTSLVRAIYRDQDDAPSQCREGQLLAALASDDKPRLSAPAQRRRLVETLLGYRDGRSEPHFKHCIRYLLHGCQEKFFQDDSLLVPINTRDIWWRIAKIALQELHAEWRLLDASFADLLSGDHRREFDVNPIDATTALSLAASVDASRFAIEPTENEYRILLRQIDDIELCKRLPIHEDLAGRFVAIDEHTFWSGTQTLPEQLSPTVRVLKRSGDDATWRRQQQLTRPLDSIAVVGIVLEHSEPGHYWHFIMDCLADFQETRDPIPEHLHKRLRASAWLPTATGDSISPQHVVHIPELADDIAQLVAVYHLLGVDSGMLAESFRQHPAFEWVERHVFPRRDEALSSLGKVLAQNEQNFIGNVNATEIPLEHWLDAFRGIPSDLCPGYSLLRRVAERFPGHAERTFEELRRTISETRAQALLDFLRTSHESERTATRKQKIRRVYGGYLRSMLTRESVVGRLREMLLPASDGTWRRASELCRANDGVAEERVLERAIEDSLKDLFPESVTSSAMRVRKGTQVPSHRGRVDDPDIVREVLASAERLRHYFDLWRDVIPSPQIGGFLSLLGDSPGVPELAQKFLGKNHSLEATRDRFGLDEYDTRKQRIIVEILQAPTITVVNLLGLPIDVPRNEKPKTLFIGYGENTNPFPEKIHAFPLCCFRLNKIDPRQFSESELSRLLRDSATRFLSEAYDYDDRQGRVAATWDELAESDQLDITITQARIVEHGFLILDQYGLRADQVLAEVLDKWDRAERLKAERQTLTISSRHVSSRNPDAELRAARDELKRLLEGNLNTHHHVLHAVRCRVADHYQYTSDSIPFELFQNADDAYAQLNALVPSAVQRTASGELPSFVVVEREDSVAFLHYGRRINQHSIEERSATRGFDDDLWKMSVLSLSNKTQTGENGEARVTGKFGLGFKSVFLVCDRPRILSGRLAFEFVGGIYPRRLIGDERSSLEEIQRRAAAGDLQATIVELRLSPDYPASEVVNRLRQLAHILVVFAIRIRRCVWSEHSKEVRWDPSEIPEVAGCQIGDLSPLFPLAGDTDVVRGLLFQSQAGAVLLGLGAREFKPFGKEVPTVWVTAPTRELLDLGFLVNGPFALDVGRAQLARDHQQNERPASDLGQSLGAQLDQLYAATSSTRWIGTRKAMGLAADADPFPLWDSLWDLLAIRVDERARHDEPAARLIRAILWNADDRGAASFYAKHRAVPARLPNDDGPLVSLRDVRWALRGVLANDRDAFAIAHRWPSFAERVSTGTLVSEAEVVLPTRRLCPSLIEHVRSIGLPEVLEWELDHGMVDPEKASRLGGVLDKKFLERLRDLAERNRIRSLLDGAEFLACDERYHPARQLLIGHSTTLNQLLHDDERFRAEFAPKDRVLNPKYGSTGITFFEACRERMEANVRLMAEWITSAASVPAKRAALTYLADGELGRELQLELVKQGLAGTWLDNVLHSSMYATLTAGQKHRLVDIVPIALPLSPPSEITSPPVSAERVLRDIHKWWTAERSQWLRDYEARTYPNGRLIHLADDNIENDAQRRKHWLTLFLLGLTHTMGRTVAEQHRGFLRDCERGGWLNVFACSERDPAQWMKFIDDYLRDKLDETRFLQWMKQFVGIYQISRNLDEYTEAFQAVPRIRRPFSLTEVTNTRTSAAFQRGGVSAPPLSAVLGIGACFVLRELIRLKVVENEHAHRHCYPPVRRVRALLQRLGCEGLDTGTRRWELSPVIHRFLKSHLGNDATFCGDFDIPLQIVAENADLQDRFLRTRIEEDDEIGEWSTDDDGISSSED